MSSNTTTIPTEEPKGLSVGGVVGGVISAATAIIVVIIIIGCGMFIKKKGNVLFIHNTLPFERLPTPGKKCSNKSSEDANELK